MDHHSLNIHQLNHISPDFRLFRPRLRRYLGCHRYQTRVTIIKVYHMGSLQILYRAMYQTYKDRTVHHKGRQLDGQSGTERTVRVFQQKSLTTVQSKINKLKLFVELSLYQMKICQSIHLAMEA